MSISNPKHSARTSVNYRYLFTAVFAVVSCLSVLSVCHTYVHRYYLTAKPISKLSDHLVAPILVF